MDISIILLNYNSRDVMGDCIRSVMRHTQGVSYEIIVVDNASPDDGAEMIERDFPNVRLVRSAENNGFAAGNNQGLRVAAGDYLVLLNTDTILEDDALSAMCSYLRAHPDVGIAGCRQLLGDGSLDWGCRRGLPTPWNSMCHMLRLDRLFPRWPLVNGYQLRHTDPSQNLRVAGLSGACMMVPRGVYEKIGGLDETYFFYGEDLDWCYRIGREFVVMYLGTVHIRHLKGGSTSRNPRIVRSFYDAMEIFYTKHLKQRYCFCVNGLVLGSISLQRRFALAKNARRTIGGAHGQT